MPAERVSMRKIRDVLRLTHALGMSRRLVGEATGIGKTAVGEYVRRAAVAGLSWPILDEIDDAELERRLFPPTDTASCAAPADGIRGSRLHQPGGLQRMGDDGLHVDVAGAWARRLGRVAYRVARSARRFRVRTVLARRGGDYRGGFAPSGRDGARMSGQAPEFCDVIGRRDAHIEQKVAGHADVLVGRPGRERRAVRHGWNGVGLDHTLARWIAPDLARISVVPLGRGRREVEAVHVGPLLDDLVGVLRLHHRIGATE